MKSIVRFSVLVFILTFGVEGYGQVFVTQQAPLPCVEKKFSVVVHIVLDSAEVAPSDTEQLLDSLIRESNIAFEPICMSFEICELNYIENFQYTEVAEASNPWNELQVKYHRKNRINFFFVNSIGNVEPYVCGFSGIGAIANRESDGIVLKTGDCLSPYSMIHELGHYFGLLHTFEGSGIELVNESNCETEGDLICDTPADPFRIGDPISDYVNGECRFISNLTDANGEYYSPIVGNYMSYYGADCSCGFTYQQYLKMANSFLNAPDKMW